MRKPRFNLFLAIALLVGLSSILFAQEEENKLEVNPEVVEKKLLPYTINLKQLIEEAQKNIKKVDEKIKEQEVFERNKEREARVREHFEKGNLLYSQAEFKAAKKEWEEAIAITKDPQMKSYLQKIEKIAAEEEIARRKEEQGEKKRLEAEEKEIQNLETKQKRQEELARKEEAARQKEAQARLEKQKREQELSRKKEEQEQKKKLQQEKKEQERLEKERQKQAELRSKEQQRIEAQQKRQAELARRKSPPKKQKKTREQKN